jgi:hypothetical protein
VAENVKASGVTLPPEVLARIDDTLGDVVQSDPRTTARFAPQQRVA